MYTDDPIVVITKKKSTDLLHFSFKEGRKEMLYLMTCSIYFIYSYMALEIWWRKEGNVLFNDAINTFYLRLYCVRYMVKDHSDSEETRCRHIGYSPINSKGSFICTIPQTGKHIPWPLLHQSWSTGWNEKIWWRTIQWERKTTATTWATLSD